MDTLTPPHREDFETTHSWGKARKAWFANLPRHTQAVPEPVIIETVRIEYVDRTEYVDRILETERTVLPEIEEIAIPDFLRFDPLEELLAEEQREGETNEATIRRLRQDIANLLAIQRDDTLTAAEGERLRYLSSKINPGE